MQEQYQLVEGETLNSLKDNVEFEMERGWQVTGGITVYHDSSIHFVQPMVIMEDKEV
jgi:hypothetical protein